MAEMKTLRIIKFGDQFSNLPSDLIAPAFASFLKPRLTVVAGRLNDFSPEKKVLYLEFLNRASAQRGMELLEKIPGTRVDWAGVNLNIYKTVDPDHQTSYVVTYQDIEPDTRFRVRVHPIPDCEFNRYLPFQRPVLAQAPAVPVQGPPVLH